MEHVPIRAGEKVRNDVPENSVPKSGRKGRARPGIHDDGRRMGGDDGFEKRQIVVHLETIGVSNDRKRLSMNRFDRAANRLTG